jgi:putative GTP pyrophosphokinase
VTVSRTKVDKAGRLLRDWWRVPSGGDEERRFDEDELAEAVGTVVDYRSGFQAPLKKVTVGLRQFVERESDDVTVGQRLKRTPQILNKLDRFSSMRLTQMEDVAGCRAILSGGAAEVSGVLKRIRRNWEVLRMDDYAALPKETGYRGLHVVVRRNGHPVEIQLRTPSQHEWAEAVERFAARTRFPLKDGKGPPELLTYLELVAWAISAEERGERPDEHFMQVLFRFKARIDHYLRTDG